MVITIEKGCPVCESDVKGDKIHKFYCAKCNILYDERQVSRHKKREEEKLEVKDVKKGKVVKTGISKKPGWLYFVDKKGDVSRVHMAKKRADKGKRKHEKVKKAGVKKEKGYLYYVDKDGDIARSPIKRGGKNARHKT